MDSQVSFCLMMTGDLRLGGWVLTQDMTNAIVPDCKM
jgi:hypothetical protein